MLLSVALMQRGMDCRDYVGAIQIELERVQLLPGIGGLNCLVEAHSLEYRQRPVEES